MVEFVSWVGVAVIALFAVVGFTGVVVTSGLTLVRMLGERRSQHHAQLEHAIRAR